ncbi:efflux RND transporter permease subunit, partial [Hansschlegelia beijingensis]
EAVALVVIVVFVFLQSWRAAIVPVAAIPVSLLDEPTANLDPAATELVEGLVDEISRRGAKVVLVSHNLGQVMRLAGDVVVLSRGRAVEHGPTRAVLTSPRSAEAQAYIKGELPWTFFAAAS